VTWKQLVRAVEAESRRQHRDTQRATVQRSRAAKQALREAERQQTRDAKEAEKLQAAEDVDDFENYLELLVSVHKDCGLTWDWQVHARAYQPPLPVRGNQREAAAMQTLQAYRPGFMEKLFGASKAQLATLNKAVEQARATEEREHADAMRRYHQECETRAVRKNLADRVLNGDLSVYGEVLEHVAAFEEIAAFRTRVAMTTAEADVIAFNCEIIDDDVVPKEELKLTAGGKLSSKDMAAGKYWALYQDHICSCALRIAGEVFAALPVTRVIVNVGTVKTNSSTGHPELNTLLASHFMRSALAKINLANIDPSDSMKNFQHRMKFKKSTGFEPVEPITTDEQWVTT